MAAIVGSIEIARLPAQIFSYVTDFAHFPEWQGASYRCTGRGLPRSPWDRQPW